MKVFEVWPNTLAWHFRPRKNRSMTICLAQSATQILESVCLTDTLNGIQERLHAVMIRPRKTLWKALWWHYHCSQKQPSRVGTQNRFQTNRFRGLFQRQPQEDVCVCENEDKTCILEVHISIRVTFRRSAYPEALFSSVAASPLEFDTNLLSFCSPSHAYSSVSYLCCTAET